MPDREAPAAHAARAGPDLPAGPGGDAPAGGAGEPAALDQTDAAGAGARYLDELDGRPVLPQTLERDLVAAAQAGDQSARARLVEAFLPLIASVARLYRDSPGVERVELVQEGVVGLLRALERYDPGRDVPFWAYAAWWVRQAMQQLVSELSRPVVLSDRALRQLARLREAHRAAVQATGREPGPDELASASGLSRDQVDKLLAADRAPRSTEEPIRQEEDEVGTFGELPTPWPRASTSGCSRRSKSGSSSPCCRSCRIGNAPSCARATAWTPARRRACGPSPTGWG